MSVAFCNLLRNISISPCYRTIFLAEFHVSSIDFRTSPRFVEKPKPGLGTSYRRLIKFPKEYTVEPLTYRNLGGRDPVTGRLVVKGIGGGIKHKYHWIDWVRDGPKEEGPPQLEKVIQILKCGCRPADVALVAVGDTLKYIIATENMKAGDILKTSRFIPRIPVKANEGDAYPLGALPIGTIVHAIERTPGQGAKYIRSAGNFGTIKKCMNGMIIVQIPSKQELAFYPECMATVGRVSNVLHSKTHIGSAVKNRELGNRPRSGLWQRKTGRDGRKIKPLPPIAPADKAFVPEPEKIRLTLGNIEN